MLKFDFEDLYKSVALTQERLEKVNLEVTKTSATYLLAETKKRTPVDKGRLIGGWNLTPVRRTYGGHSFEIFNPVEYASYVEEGHETSLGNRVEGRYMLELAQNQLQANLRAIVEASIRKVK